MTPGGALIHLYAKDPTAAIHSTYEIIAKEAVDYEVYLADNFPSRWHYNKTDDAFDRIGDIVLVAKMPKAFRLSRGRRMSAAEHGYDPAIPDMRASFFTHGGPEFRQHKKIDGFENIHVYPLIAKILGLQITEKIDGDVKVLKSILK